MDKKKEDLEFESKRKFLVEELQTLGSFKDVYNVLIQKWREEREIVEFAPHFFDYVRRALWAYLIHQVYRLASDKNRHATSIPKYLEFIKKNQAMIGWENSGKFDIEQSIELHEQKLKTEFKSTLRSVRGRRNSWYGHFGEDFFANVENLNTEYPLTRDDITLLYKFLCEIINEYSGLYDGVVYGWKATGTDSAFGTGDIIRIFDLIRKEIGK